LPIKPYTITFDNGTEFANHHQIADQTKSDVYFVHPYYSWERGLNENTNGLIRQYAPKQQNFKKLDHDDFKIIQDRLNNRPRKSIGFLSILNVFNETLKAQLVAFET